MEAIFQPANNERTFDSAEFDQKSCTAHRWSALNFVQILAGISLEHFSVEVMHELDLCGSVVLLHNELMKLTLIKWLPGKESSIHGHPDGGCIFKVLSGMLTEERFDEQYNLRSESLLFNQAINYIDDKIGFHRVRNGGGEIAYSVHFYTF